MAREHRHCRNIATLSNLRYTDAFSSSREQGKQFPTNKHAVVDLPATRPYTAVDFEGEVS